MLAICYFSPLQQSFNNGILLLKLFNINNWINKFSQCTCFVTLWSMGPFTTHLKTQILFPGWRGFLIWHMSYAFVLIFKWIRYQQNMGTWCSDTVIIFWGVSKDYALSSLQEIWTLGAVTLQLFILGVSKDWTSS